MGKGMREADAGAEWGCAARTMRYQRKQSQLTSALTTAILEFGEISFKWPGTPEQPLWRAEPRTQASPPASNADVLIRLLHSGDKKVLAGALSERIEIATNHLGDEEWRMQLEDLIKIRNRVLSLREDLYMWASLDLIEEGPNRSSKLYQASLVNADFQLLHKTIYGFVTKHDIYTKLKDRDTERRLWKGLLYIFSVFTPARDKLLDNSAWVRAFLDGEKVISRSAADANPGSENDAKMGFVLPWRCSDV
jgi:hypothetical protein